MSETNPHPSQFKIHPAMAAAPCQDPLGRIVEYPNRYKSGRKISIEFSNPKKEEFGPFLPISESSPLLAVIPQALLDIAANLASQNNRMTNNPIFLVQKKVRQTGLDLNYCDNQIWIDLPNDYTEVTDPKEISHLEELDAKYPLTEEESQFFSAYMKTGYTDHWETIQPFFTEVEADLFIAANKHRYDGELRTYVEWGGRNPEWQAIRNFLLSLNPPKASSVPAAPPFPHPPHDSHDPYHTSRRTNHG